MHLSLMALPPILSWQDNTTLVLQGPLHDLLRKVVYLLVKFNNEGNTIAFEHIINYECKLQSLNIAHNDVVCRLCPLTFC
jgi:hypothetical protein